MRSLLIQKIKCSQSSSELITAPKLSYISLQSALHFHGMISQIPQVVYSVSLARTKAYRTPIGTFSSYHIQPDLFFEYESQPPYQIKMATPEKALLDILLNEEQL